MELVSSTYKYFHHLLVHSDANTAYYPQTYKEEKNPVQYGLIVQHQDLALKCRFLEFEAYSNAALSLRLKNFYLCY